MLCFKPFLAGCAAGSMLLVASVPAGARDVTPVRAVQLAQNSQCQAWAARLNQQIAAFNSQCSGTLDPSTYAHCQRWQRELNDEIANYNSQCGR